MHVSIRRFTTSWCDQTTHSKSRTITSNRTRHSIIARNANVIEEINMMVIIYRNTKTVFPLFELLSSPQQFVSSPCKSEKKRLISNIPGSHNPTKPPNRISKEERLCSYGEGTNDKTTATHPKRYQHHRRGKGKSGKTRSRRTTLNPGSAPTDMITTMNTFRILGWASPRSA